MKAKHKTPRSLIDTVRKNGSRGRQPRFNSLPNIKILHWSKLKTFAENKINETKKKRNLFREGLKTLWIKGENAGY